MKKIFAGALTAIMLLGNVQGAIAADVPDWLQTGGITAAQPSSTAAKQQSTIDFGGKNVLSNIRYGDSASRLRIVMDLSRPASYSVNWENNNTRLVVNMNGMTTSLSDAPALRSNAVNSIVLGSYGCQGIYPCQSIQASYRYSKGI